MEEMLLDFAADDTSAGFRLHKFEVLNWGTFDRNIWNMPPGGCSSLVTGDIGSGKTTLVDGIATLLVPPGKISYNKTASSDAGKERTLYTYIRGEFKKLRGEESGKGEAQYLRDENAYSVLLAYFYNEGFNQQVTLAQVFSIRNHKVETFYVVSTDALSIGGDFTGFGTDIKGLKDRLAKCSNTKIYSAFSEYSSRFRQIFGGLSEEAFLLFRDTISTKEIKDLTGFVQALMLEKSEKTIETIEDLCNNFDNLNQSYNAVIKAKDQIELLRPIASQGERYYEQERLLASILTSRKAAPSYFARFAKTLREDQILKTTEAIEKMNSKIGILRDRLNKDRQTAGVLQSNIDKAGGGLLKQLEEQSIFLTSESEKKRRVWDDYQKCLQTLKLVTVYTEAEFFSTRSLATGLLDEVDRQRVENDKTLFDERTALNVASAQLVATGNEIDSLKKRKSNISDRILTIRTAMCTALDIDEDKLPFVGELIQVNESEKAWQGPIERVLHNFGLSMLVSDNLYSKVSTYVDQTNLRGKIVYYRVRKEDTKKSRRDTEPNSLVRKLDVHHESEFSEYLHCQLNERFSDYICCGTMEEFRKNPKAVTLQGQIKSGNQRHEKDDRKDINNAKEFILGWNNKEKILALEKELDGLFHTRTAIDKKIKILDGLLTELKDRGYTITKLVEQFTDFADLDWESVVKEIAVLQAKIREIEESSSVIETLNKQLSDLNHEINLCDTESIELAGKRGGLTENLVAYRLALAKTIDMIDMAFEDAWPGLDVLAKDNLSTVKFTLDNIERLEKDLVRHLDVEVERWEKQNKNLHSAICSLMTAYQIKYPAETNEFNAVIESLGEFVKALRKLEEEDLPRHQSNFKMLLHQQTINGFSLLSNELDRSSDEIVERIGRINHSLKEIEYNPGHYIALLHDRRWDRDVIEFKAMIKDCLSGAIGEDDRYNEDRFCKVKDVVLKLRTDRAWANKVTDVRNWFTFSARETVREDSSEWETYDDTTGKSGGQKEKLAYTILASALAYQFGLSWGEKQSRSFRFIAVDEAFGRMSEESTRYGLELFKKLNLQFLIITPLQKINIIENYVKTIHYVHNVEGKNSVLRNMTIEEYHLDKDNFVKKDMERQMERERLEALAA